MSGLLRGWLNDEGWEQACRYANACGALVVSRHGCAPAMPTKVELDDYLQRAGIGAAPGRRRAPQPPAPGHQPPSAVAGAVHFRL
ncbi:PfkB family carbohydrate kinase [Klebsiella pneumoniae subsp. pneumoniae]|nr:PfkB family carbohydrate kinase [Klebsiella pneumoniae subsp. pneumoniae]